MNQRTACRFVFLAVAAAAAGASQTDAAVLSDNLGQPVSYTELIDPTTTVAASFGTGTQASTLSKVQLLIQSDGPAVSTVSLYSDQGGRPGGSIGALTSLQPPNQSTLSVTTFSGNNLALAANTTYWIVTQADPGTLEWAYTESNMGSGSGFQHTWGLSLDGGAWFVSSIEPMMMSVEDSSTATPEPGSVLLVALGGVGLSVWGRKRLKVGPQQ